MMTGYRKHRVEELVRQCLAEIVAFKIKDPRVTGVTITEVNMSPDLKSARVYFSCLGDDKIPDHQRGLESAESFLRKKLREDLDLKYIPHLSFHYDTAFDNSLKINTILKKLKVEDLAESE